MPRRLLRDGEIVVDEWHYLGDGRTPELADVGVDSAFDQWLADREQWLSRDARSA